MRAGRTYRAPLEIMRFSFGPTGPSNTRMAVSAILMIALALWDGEPIAIPFDFIRPDVAPRA